MNQKKKRKTIWLSKVHNRSWTSNFGVVLKALQAHDWMCLWLLLLLLICWSQILCRICRLIIHDLLVVSCCCQWPIPVLTIMSVWIWIVVLRDLACLIVGREWIVLRCCIDLIGLVWLLLLLLLWLNGCRIDIWRIHFGCWQCCWKRSVDSGRIVVIASINIVAACIVICAICAQCGRLQATTLIQVDFLLFL